MSLLDELSILDQKIARGTREYWYQRATYRTLRSEIGGVKIMNDVIPLYEQALKNINKEINKVYVNYADDTGLDVAELTKVLSGVDRNNFIKDIQKKMKVLGFDIGDIYNKKFLTKLTRLEAIKQQVYWEVRKISPREVGYQTQGYRKIVEDSYEITTMDIREGMGRTAGFATIDGNIVDEILSTEWAGRTYIDSTGRNVELLGSEIRDIVGGGLLSGTSSQKMARQVTERVDIGVYRSMRLIRTETNYFQNQGELQSYKDEGIEFYKYEAVLDNRTSDICEHLNGHNFKVEDATVGENYPPMHPNCRSTTLVLFRNEALEEGYEKMESGFDDLYETQMKGLESEGYDRKRMEMKID
jgi:SPP1 gp7 family putative phage head morphogenesis protein